MMAVLDRSFSRYAPDGVAGKFTKGRNIFDGQPARIGFIVALGIAILGRPGADRTGAQRSARVEDLEKSVNSMV